MTRAANRTPHGLSVEGRLIVLDEENDALIRIGDDFLDDLLRERFAPQATARRPGGSLEVPRVRITVEQLPCPRPERADAAGHEAFDRSPACQATGDVDGCPPSGQRAEEAYETHRPPPQETAPGRSTARHDSSDIPGQEPNRP